DGNGERGVRREERQGGRRDVLRALHRRGGRARLTRLEGHGDEARRPGDDRLAAVTVPVPATTAAVTVPTASTAVPLVSGDLGGGRADGADHQHRYHQRAKSETTQLAKVHVSTSFLRHLRTTSRSWELRTIPAPL